MTFVNSCTKINLMAVLVLSEVTMPNLKELESWMGTGQVSKKLGYSRQGVINLAVDKKLRAVKTGAGWLYDPDSVEAFSKRDGKK